MQNCFFSAQPNETKPSVTKKEPDKSVPMESVVVDENPSIVSRRIDAITPSFASTIAGVPGLREWLHVLSPAEVAAAEALVADDQSHVFRPWASLTSKHEADVHRFFRQVLAGTTRWVTECSGERGWKQGAATSRSRRGEFPPTTVSFHRGLHPTGLWGRVGVRV